MLNLKQHIVTVPDFPSSGIRFRDITPLLANPEAFTDCIRRMAEAVKTMQADALVAVESRGFIFAMPIAEQLGLPVILVRKPGKLPRKTVEINYALEYGQDTLHVHAEDIDSQGQHVIIDDVLATGGTAAATCDLIEKAGGQVAGLTFLMELAGLDGRERLAGYTVETLLDYQLHE